MPIEGGRDAPDPAPPGAKFALLFRRVFDKSIGRIANNGMERIGLLGLEPLEAIGKIELGLTVTKNGFDGIACRGDGLSNRRNAPQSVGAARRALELAGSVEPQIRPHGRLGQLSLHALGDRLADFRNGSFGCSAAKKFKNRVANFAGLSALFKQMVHEAAS